MDRSIRHVAVHDEPRKEGARARATLLTTIAGHRAAHTALAQSLEAECQPLIKELTVVAAGSVEAAAPVSSPHGSRSSSTNLTMIFTAEVRRRGQMRVSSPRHVHPQPN
jgi:hypothetical protein